MIDGLKPYETYKDSGSEWVARVPAHWEVRRAKYFFREVDERSTSGDEEMLSVSHKTGVSPRREKNVTMFMAESNVGQKRCAPGDVAVNTMWAWMAALGVVKHHGIVSPSYGTYRPHDATRFEATYLDDLLRIPAYRDEYVVRSTGITSSRLRLYPESFLRIPFPCPPWDEQQLIVRFLHHADQRIRRYIRAKRELIGLLEEQKRVIISRAVTSGLDPGAALKPSGVEWLESVPAHWDVRSVGASAKSVQTGPFGSQVHASDYLAGGVPLANPAHLVDGRIIPDSRVAVSQSKATELARHTLRPGDVVVARRGDLGRCAVVTDQEAGFLCGTGSLRIRLRPDVFVPDFFAAVFGSTGVRGALVQASLGATMANLNAGAVARLRLACPPIEEQVAILASIRVSSHATTRSLVKIKRETDLLREYRSRLVTDVATGKLDVRAAAAALSDIAGEGSDANQDEATDGDGDNQDRDGLDDALDYDAEAAEA